MNYPTDLAGPGCISVICGAGAQVVMRTALLDAGAPPSVVGALEMHGTGTSLGDPIEIGAVSEVFAAPGDAPQRAGACQSTRCPVLLSAL